MVACFLLPGEADSYKRDSAGRLLLVCGSYGMAGGKWAGGYGGGVVLRCGLAALALPRSMGYVLLRFSIGNLIFFA